MESLPIEIANMILAMKYQMEHTQKMKKVIKEINNICYNCEDSECPLPQYGENPCSKCATTRRIYNNKETKYTLHQFDNQRYFANFSLSAQYLLIDTSPDIDNFLIMRMWGDG